MEQWVNKVAIVTGVGSGIGLAIAEQLVNNGIKVVGLGLNVDKIKVLAVEWKSKPGKLIPLQCDLSNESEIIGAIDWIEKNLGVVEILVNNAAVNLPTLLSETSVQDWIRSLNVNILAPVILIKSVLGLLKKKGLNSGIIININDIGAWNSLSVDLPLQVSTSYLTTKNALRGLTDGLRLELANIQSNIKVINIIPGLVDTEMSGSLLKEKPLLALKPKDIADAVIYVIQTPENVLIQDLVITPIREVVV